MRERLRYTCIINFFHTKQNRIAGVEFSIICYSKQMNKNESLLFIWHFVSRSHLRFSICTSRIPSHANCLKSTSMENKSEFIIKIKIMRFQTRYYLLSKKMRMVLHLLNKNTFSIIFAIQFQSVCTVQLGCFDDILNQIVARDRFGKLKQKHSLEMSRFIHTYIEFSSTAGIRHTQWMKGSLRNVYDNL